MAAYRQWALMFSTVKAQNIGMVGRVGRFMPVSPIRRLLLVSLEQANQRCRVAYQLDLHTKEPFI